MMKWGRRVGIGTVLLLSLVFCGSASAQQVFSEFGTTPSPYISFELRMLLVSLLHILGRNCLWDATFSLT